MDIPPPISLSTNGRRDVTGNNAISYMDNRERCSWESAAMLGRLDFKNP